MPKPPDDEIDPKQAKHNAEAFLAKEEHKHLKPEHTTQDDDVPVEKEPK